MPNIYDDGDFSAARVNGPAQVEYPFYGEGDSATRIIRQPMMVDAGAYAPLALDTAHPTITGAYFVGDEQHMPAGAGILSFVRVYATIPPFRESPLGSMSHPFPAITTTAGGTLLPAVTGVGARGGVLAPGVLTQINFAAAHTAAIGEPLMVSLPYSYMSGGASYGGQMSGIASVTHIVSPTSLAINYLYPYWLGFLTWDTANSKVWRNIVQQREEKTINTGSKAGYTYFLPGVTSGIETWADIPIEQPFSPVLASNGNEVTYVSNVTIPTANDYVGMVGRGEFLIASSAVSRWLGNIFVRETILVAAK